MKEKIKISIDLMGGDNSPKKIIDWFGPNEPLSGFGKMILGESLVLTGNKQRGTSLIKKGFVKNCSRNFKICSTCLVKIK